MEEVTSKLRCEGCTRVAQRHGQRPTAMAPVPDKIISGKGSSYAMVKGETKIACWAQELPRPPVPKLGNWLGPCDSSTIPTLPCSLRNKSEDQRTSPIPAQRLAWKHWPQFTTTHLWETLQYPVHTLII